MSKNNLVLLGTFLCFAVFIPGKIKAKIDPDANTAYYLGIRERPRRMTT